MLKVSNLDALEKQGSASASEGSFLSALLGHLIGSEVELTFEGTQRCYPCSTPWMWMSGYEFAVGLNAANILFLGSDLTYYLHVVRFCSWFEHSESNSSSQRLLLSSDHPTEEMECRRYSVVSRGGTLGTICVAGNPPKPALVNTIDYLAPQPSVTAELLMQVPSVVLSRESKLLEIYFEDLVLCIDGVFVDCAVTKRATAHELSLRGIRTSMSTIPTLPVTLSLGEIELPAHILEHLRQGTKIMIPLPDRLEIGLEVGSRLVAAGDAVLADGSMQITLREFIFSETKQLLTPNSEQEQDTSGRLPDVGYLPGDEK